MLNIFLQQFSERPGNDEDGIPGWKGTVPQVVIELGYYKDGASPNKMESVPLPAFQITSRRKAET